MDFTITNKPEAPYTHNKVFELINSLDSEQARIIDFGCELPKLLFELQMKFGFKSLSGLEILKTEKEVIARHEIFTIRVYQTPIHQLNNVMKAM